MQRLRRARSEQSAGEREGKRDHLCTSLSLSLSAEANEAETAEDAEIRDRWMDTRGQEDGEDLERRIRYTITTTLMMT